MKREKPNVPALLGQVVKVRRQKLGFSQEELAWRAGLNRTYVTDVERGARNLSLNTIDRLASALQTPLSALLHDVDKARGTVRGTGAFEPAQVDILLVEDNARDEELTLRALRRARLTNLVHVARNGTEALNYIFCTGPENTADRKTVHNWSCWTSSCPKWMGWKYCAGSRPICGPARYRSSC